MQILSFDVGIKNLAYCILNESKQICDWNVINIIDNNNNIICTCDNKCGSKCKSKASFYCIDGESKIGYCKKHSKNVNDLIPIINKKIKKISVNEMSELLFTSLDKYPNMLNVNTVLIENQPCLMNPMIKTVQVLLYSYFVIKGKLHEQSTISKVQFINARNKLSLYDGPPIEQMSTNKYTQRKKEGIEVCKYVLNDDDDYLNFFLSHKKKDDLADSYLQGLWFLSR